MAGLPILMERLIRLVRKKGGSDIHLLEGEPPRLRIHGDLRPIESKEHPVITREDIQDILDFALTPEQKQTFHEKMDIDFSLDFEGASGRVNCGLANGRKMHLIMRYLPAEIIPLDQLGIDFNMLKELSSSEDGLIVVSGETSSGKTTTIAAMLDYINHTRLGAISTIENPVEYVLTSDKCLITRREIGRDTPNFRTALRSSVRKNPDVLLIGEVRDVETANIAITAAETGILSFCTLHAVGAIPAITRLSNIMISETTSEEDFYLRLSLALRGIISQQLAKHATEERYIPLFEILNITYAERTYLREKNIERLEQSLETERNISLGRCIYTLWNKHPRPINEKVIHRVYGNQYNLAMNRLRDTSGYKPLAGMG